MTQIGVLLGVASEKAGPFFFQRCSARNGLTIMTLDLSGNAERRQVRPSQVFSRRACVLRSHRFAMNFRRVVQRAPISDVSSYGDQRRPLLFSYSLPDGSLNCFEVISVWNRNHLPSERPETAALVFGENVVGGRVKRHMIVVVKTNKFSQLQRPRQRCCFRRD